MLNNQTNENGVLLFFTILFW